MAGADTVEMFCAVATFATGTSDVDTRSVDATGCTALTLVCAVTLATGAASSAVSAGSAFCSDSGASLAAAAGSCAASAGQWDSGADGWRAFASLRRWDDLAGFSGFSSWLAGAASPADSSAVFSASVFSASVFSVSAVSDAEGLALATTDLGPLRPPRTQLPADSLFSPGAVAPDSTLDSEDDSEDAELPPSKSEPVSAYAYAGVNAIPIPAATAAAPNNRVYRSLATLPPGITRNTARNDEMCCGPNELECQPSCWTRMEPVGASSA